MAVENVTFSDLDDSWSGVEADRWYRDILAASTTTNNGIKIRIQLKAHPSSNTTVLGTSVGEREASTEDYDATPSVAGAGVTRITWDTGNNGCVITNNTTKWSDWVDYIWDTSYAHLIHVGLDDTGGTVYASLRPSYLSGCYYDAAGGDETMIEDVTEDGSTSSFYMIQALEIEYVSTADKLSNDAESKLLAHIFKNTQYSQPSNLYVALCKSTVEDDDTGSTLPSEVSGGSYQRTLCNTWDTSTTPGTADSDITIEFPKATAAWGTVTDFAICDAQTLGNVICYGKFTTARNIGNGDRFIIDTGDLDATLS